MVTRRSTVPRRVAGLGPLLALLLLAAALPARSRVGSSALAAVNTARHRPTLLKLCRAVLQPQEFAAYSAGDRGAHGSAWEGVEADALAAPSFDEPAHESALRRAEKQGWVTCASDCVEAYRGMLGKLPKDLAVEALVLRDPDGSRVMAAVEAARSAGLKDTQILSVHAPFLSAPDRKRVPDVERVLGLATLWSLRWPVAVGTRITSPFGERVHPVTGKKKMHDGVDLATPTGTPLSSPGGGKVLHVGQDSISGLYIVLDHGHGVHSVSCHLSEATVERSQAVEQGASYARTGSSGRVTGPHLHYALRLGGRFVDPVAASRRSP